MVAYEMSPGQGPLRQGEILSNVVEVRFVLESLKPDTDPLLHEIVHPYVVVLTQDCDLDWDYKSRCSTDAPPPANKLVPNVLLCPAMMAEDLRVEQGMNAAIWRRASSNADERFHFLPSVPGDLDGHSIGIPSLVIDFKRVLTVPTDELYYRLEVEAQRRCFLVPPFLHSLSTRFTYFAGRVGLPESAATVPTPPLALPPVGV